MKHIPLLVMLLVSSPVMAEPETPSDELRCRKWADQKVPNSKIQCLDRMGKVTEGVCISCTWVQAYEKCLYLGVEK